jgi:hypothetical protein
MTREEIIDAYSSAIVDDMDSTSLLMLAYECLYDRLDKMSDDLLLMNVRHLMPDATIDY